jgi:hypothetical protein
MRRATGVLADRSTSWDKIEGDWDATDYMLEFWGLATAHAVKTHGGPEYPGEASELESLAGFALIEFARDWSDGRVVEEAALQDRRLFWHMLKKRISWAIIPHKQSLTRDNSLDANPDEDPEYWSNQIHARIENRSNVNIILVQAMMTLRTGLRALLALAFYEELPSDQVEKLLGAAQGFASTCKRVASERLLECAVSLTATRRHERRVYPDLLAKWTPTAEFLDWLEGTYRTRDVQGYLDYVAAMFAVDASYMVDVLWFAHGVYRVAPTARKNTGIDPGVARELTEARYAAGMTQGDAVRGVAALGLSLNQAKLSSFERMKRGLRDETIAALRRVYSDAVPGAKRGGGRDPRRWGNNY